MSGMRFETSQSMKLGQQMKLAPRMIQSMEILQMPLAELEERIELELSSNPTLELGDGIGEAAEAQEGLGGDISGEQGDAFDAEGSPQELSIDESGREDFARLDEFGADNPEAAENAFEEDGDRAHGTEDAAPQSDRWESLRDDSYRPSSRLSGERDAKSEAMAQTAARGGSLQDQLLRQWGVVEVDEALRPIGEVLIGFLEEDGYLRVGLDEVRDKGPWAEAGIAGEPPGEEMIALGLTAVQMLLEPPGVGARNARECLLLQVDAQLDRLADMVLYGEERDAGLAVAPADVLRDVRTLVSDHLDDLAKNKLPRVSAASGLGLDEIKRALEAMRRLSLAPAKQLVEDRADPITPDAAIEYDEANDRYVAYLTDSRMSNLMLNREYALMAKDRAVPKRDRDFLKKNLSNAQWLMDAVEQRRGTVLRVLEAVIDEQRAYFDEGPEALKPLPMTLVAERLGVHVATVSRAVADKHVLTPRGVAPLRSFFTGGLSTESGEEVSANAVKAALQEVLDGEDRSRPLSDEALAKALQERGFEIARRTIAKYRGQMGVGSARMRKEF